jgi:phosphatidylglycerophosphate synthase
MQAVVAIPEITSLVGNKLVCHGKTRELIMPPVAGVPLLIRTLITAARAGADDILLICPAALGNEQVGKFLETALQYGLRVSVIQLDEFDPGAASSWAKLTPHLNHDFLWLPWNWVTTKQFLAHLPLAQIHSVNWAEPAHATFYEVTRDNAPFALLHPEGVAVTSPETVSLAERFLVVHSGKVLDGIHTSFNRRLCRPFVRVLSHTSASPNAVTLGGVVISILSADAFAQGSYWWSVLGALLFYLAGLFDEMDGMLARVRFAESPRGTWFEGFADGLSYLLLFGGITIGLDRHYGWPAAAMGLALLVGAILALIATSLQRRRATTSDRPHEYLGRFYHLLEKDSGNWISRVVRRVQAFQKRGVMIHYIVLFTVIGALPVLFFLATLGAHLTWILTLYFNRRFFAQPAERGAKPDGSAIKEVV